jgi:hypothetical protein
MTCSLINEIFYNMHKSNNDCCMHIFAELQVHKGHKLSLEMRTKEMDDAQGYYIHRDEMKGLNTNL